MKNPESEGTNWSGTARLVVGILAIVLAAFGILLTMALSAESAPQQTVQELRYIKWLVIGLVGLLILKA